MSGGERRSRTVDWDAARYDRVAAPQEAWAREVLARLPLEGDETVIDAGCGSGRVTRLLLERLPRGRVIGVDGSASMITMAREALAEFGDRIEFVQSDLLEFAPREPVDAVFSSATFHWIPDHARLFARLFAALRPGGRLVAQCGGRGNVAEWVAVIREVAAREPFAAHLADFEEPWNFAGPDDTEKLLAAAGFEQIRCWLEERIAEPESARDFVAVAGLTSHRDRLPEDLREAFIDAVMDGLQTPLRLRYVRLNIDARRPQ